MSLKTRIALVFWTHFLVALLSHVFVFFMFGGVMNLFLSASHLVFWDKALMLGLTFFSGMYAVNHVTNSEGFCALTDLENFYRRQAQVEEVGRFTPRFYRKCGAIWRRSTSFLRKKV